MEIYLDGQLWHETAKTDVREAIEETFREEMDLTRLYEITAIHGPDWGQRAITKSLSGHGGQDLSRCLIAMTGGEQIAVVEYREIDRFAEMDHE